MLFMRLHETSIVYTCKTKIDTKIIRMSTVPMSVGCCLVRISRKTARKFRTIQLNVNVTPFKLTFISLGN